MFSVHFATPPDDAVRLLVLIGKHPDRLEVVRAAYRGRHDVLEALWWRLHPLEPSPAGTPDPCAARDALQRLAFSRHDEDCALVVDRDLVTGEMIWLTADELQLRDFDLALADDARALDQAVAGFVATYPPSASAELQHQVSQPQVAQPRDVEAFVDHHARDGHRFPPWFPVAAVALLLGLAVTTGTLWWRLQDVSGRLASTTDVAADPVRSWHSAAVTPLAALLVFNRAQTLDDVYPLELPVAYDNRAVRQLTRSNTGDSYRLFGALVQPDQICLVIVFADLSTTSSCLSEREFEEDGLTVITHASRVQEKPDPEGSYVSHSITWEPNGTFTSGLG